MGRAEQAVAPNRTHPKSRRKSQAKGGTPKRSALGSGSHGQDRADKTVLSFPQQIKRMMYLGHHVVSYGCQVSSQGHSSQ